MKMTLQEKADVLRMQYILESLIEDYNEATYESDRYRIKLVLLDFIKKTSISLKQVIDYLSLNEDKFEPFLAILKDISEDDKESIEDLDLSSIFGSSSPNICCIIRG